MRTRKDYEEEIARLKEESSGVFSGVDAQVNLTLILLHVALDIRDQLEVSHKLETKRRVEELESQDSNE